MVVKIVADTSPRGEGVPGDPANSYDFGLGAGFYVDATEAPFNRNYHMWTYVTDELPKLIAEQFPVDAKRQSIMGHSMGGDVSPDSIGIVRGVARGGWTHRFRLPSRRSRHRAASLQGFDRAGFIERLRRAESQVLFVAGSRTENRQKTSRAPPGER